MKRLRTAALLLCVLVWLAVDSLPVAAAWLGTYSDRISLIIDKDKLDSSLSDFPVMVHLSASSGIGGVDVTAVFDELTSDANRKKIAFTTDDGQTQLYAEIEKWDDGNESAYLWVKVPSVASGSDTKIYMYYDSSQANNDSYIGDPADAVTHNVWDADFVGVWHMNQDPDLGDILDSTAYGHDMTTYNMDTNDLVGGKVGNALEFSVAADGYLDHAHNADLMISVGVAEALVFFTDAGSPPAVSGILAKAGSDADGYELELNNGGQSGGLGALADSTWYYTSVKYDGVNATWYLNEALSTPTAKTIVPNVRVLNIADRGWSPSFIWEGKLDEIRISKSARSNAWIKATYYTCFDNFVTFGFAVCASVKTSSTTASAIIVSARYYLNEPTEVFWLDVELLAWLNTGTMDIFARGKVLECSESIDLSVGTIEYALSERYLGITDVIYVNSDSASKGLIRSNPRSVGHTSVDEPAYWYEIGGMLGIFPATSTASETATVYYLARPTDVATDESVLIPAHYENALSLFIAARAWIKDEQLAKSDRAMAEYYEEIDRFRIDYNERIKRTRESVQ